MAFTMPKNNNAMPKAVAQTFMNSSNANAFSHPKQKGAGRGGVKIAIKNPFQGAINKEALALKKY